MFDMMVSIDNNQEKYARNLERIIEEGGATVFCDQSSLFDLQYFFLLKQKHEEIKKLTITFKNSKKPGCL